MDVQDSTQATTQVVVVPLDLDSSSTMSTVSILASSVEEKKRVAKKESMRDEEEEGDGRVKSGGVLR